MVLKISVDILYTLYTFKMHAWVEFVFAIVERVFITIVYPGQFSFNQGSMYNQRMYRKAYFARFDLKTFEEENALKIYLLQKVWQCASATGLYWPGND